MAGADRISALPEEIKVSILSRLPITDAVRSSALSRSWRHLWTLLPGFHADLDSDRGPIRCPENVGRILSSLRGPIRHFSLRFLIPDNEQSCLHHFLDLILQKGGLWNLSVHCYGTLRRVQLPCFRSLKHLDLSFIHISLPSDFGGFEQLASLKLHLVYISQQDIQSLIDGSKNLTSVELSFERFLAPVGAASEQPLSVTFNSPLLKYLSFNFGGLGVEARIVSAPCLETAHVTAGTEILSPPKEITWCSWATLKFLADVAHISNLSLNIDVLMCLSKFDVPHTLRVHFRQLRCLKLIGPTCYMARRMFKVLCCLLRSMPFLENLELQCHGWGHNLNKLDPIPPNEYKKKKDGYLCLDKTLRRVAISMENLRGLKDFMWMIHFILLNANVLELIKLTYSNDNKVKSRILEELSEVEKASTDARVVFVDTNDVSW